MFIYFVIITQDYIYVRITESDTTTIISITSGDRFQGVIINVRI